MASVELEPYHLHIELLRSQLQRIRPPLSDTEIVEFLRVSGNNLGFFATRSGWIDEELDCSLIVGLEVQLKSQLLGHVGPWSSWIQYDKSSPSGGFFKSTEAQNLWWLSLHIETLASPELLIAVRRSVLDGAVHQSVLGCLNENPNLLLLLGPCHFASTIPIKQFVRSDREFQTLNSEANLMIYRQYHDLAVARKIKGTKTKVNLAPFSHQNTTVLDRSVYNTKSNFISLSLLRHCGRIWHLSTSFIRQIKFLILSGLRLMSGPRNR